MDKEKEKLMVQEVEIRYFTQLSMLQTGFISLVLLFLWCWCIISLIFISGYTVYGLSLHIFTNEPDIIPPYELVAFLMKSLLIFGIPAYIFRRLQGYLDEKKRLALLQNRLNQFHKKHGKQLKDIH